MRGAPLASAMFTAHMCVNTLIRNGCDAPGGYGQVVNGGNYDLGLREHNCVLI